MDEFELTFGGFTLNFRDAVSGEMDIWLYNSEGEGMGLTAEDMSEMLGKWFEEKF